MYPVPLGMYPERRGEVPEWVGLGFERLGMGEKLFVLLSLLFKTCSFGLNSYHKNSFYVRFPNLQIYFFRLTAEKNC